MAAFTEAHKIGQNITRIQRLHDLGIHPLNCVFEQCLTFIPLFKKPDKTEMHTAKSKKSGYRRRSIGFQLYDIQEKAKPWTQGKDLWLPGLRVGGEGGEQADTGDLPGSETAL